MTKHHTGARVAVRRNDAPQKALIATGALVLALMGWAVAARAETVITAHGISTFGDLKYPADFKPLDSVNPDAPKGGEISEWTQGGFDSMNPFSVKGRAGALSSAMLESVMVGTYDEIGASYCLLCETIEYPEDRSWVIFNLRADAKFSDGTPVTGDDLVFAYETFLNKGLSDFRTIFAQEVESVELLAPLKVKFTFKPGIPHRDLPAKVGGLNVFSKTHYLANKLDMEESFMTPYLGSGPYMVDKIDVGQTLVYRRNPDYWGKDLPIMKGTGNFDTIRIEYFADTNAAFEAFKSGTYTFRNENSSKSWATQYDFPAVASGAVKKDLIDSGAKANGQAFLFNLRRETFKDPKVREAISLMFNFEWSNTTLFYGIYARINSIWENSWLAAEGPASPEEVAILQPLVDEGLLPASILTDTPVMGATSGERQLDRGNLRKASALLDEAGWAVGADGMRRNAKGEALKVEFLNDNPSFDRVVNPFVENLRALGIDAKLTSVDDAQFTERTRPPAYDFDIITGNARSDYLSGSELKQFYGSATADDSAFNIMGLKSPAVDKLIEVIMATKTKDELTIATKALDRVLRAERFWIPQWYKNQHTVAYFDMFEHPQNMPPYALGEMDIWWYNAEKAAALKASGALK